MNYHLTEEGFRALVAWIDARRDDPDALAELLKIVEAEVERGLRANGWKARKVLTEPCRE
jgi:hypothetical protein